MEAQLIFQSSKDDKIMQFYMISVSFFHVFIVNNWGKRPPPDVGVLARFYRPGMGVLKFFCSGVGNSPIKKIATGGWSGLELSDT